MLVKCFSRNSAYAVVRLADSLAFEMNIVQENDSHLLKPYFYVGFSPFGRLTKL